jgi:pyrimidine operon attenuation protein/uracil phosphoribosyltransferase
MELEKTLILNQLQIKQKVNRIAYQIYEDNFEESEIIIAGIHHGGYKFAKRIVDALKEIAPLKVSLIEVILDKENPFNEEVKLSGSDIENSKSFNGKVVILVDDVLNSGKTLIYAMKPFLEMPLKKLRIVVLVNRNHKRYPVSPDFSGINLSTTLQEHIFVELNEKEDSVYLG